MIDYTPAAPFAVGLTQDPDFQREAAQVQAKALLFQVAERIPDYRWNYVLHRLLRNVSLATLQLQNVAATAPERIGDLTSVARRVAILWEALAILPEGPDKEAALLNAAVAYELAGYQANAACLAQRLARPEWEVDPASLQDIARLFIERRFHRLLKLSEPLQQEPDLTDHASVELISDMAKALAARALSNAARYFLSGHTPLLQEASTTLQEAEQLYTALNHVEAANLTHSMGALLPVMRRRSIWQALGHVLPGRKWHRYLQLLARGLGTDVFTARSVSELWPSQVRAIENGLFTSQRTKVIRMPTSAGKTRIAEMAIVHTLLTQPGSKCVYVAPYRALATELHRTLLHLLHDLGFRVSSLVGSYESDEFEELLFRESDVLVVTPEKLDLVERTTPELIEATRLYVLDEVHLVGDFHRGAKFELLLSRLKAKHPTARFIVASAVVPDDTLTDFANWFGSDPHSDVVSLDWRPSVLRAARFEWRKDTGVITYAPSEEDSLLRQFVPGVIRSRQYQFINPATSRRNTRRFPEIGHKAQICAELALEFARLGPVLVFCAQTNWVDAVAAALHDRLVLIDRIGSQRPLAFSDAGGSRSALLAEEWLGDRPISSWLRAGIGVHHGGLPDSIRTAIEEDFRERRLQVLVATNTLAQGVNLPFKTVIVHSCRRYIEGEMQRISARDYWNIAGRAGRAGHETEGLIVHVTLTSQDSADFRDFLQSREAVESVESALYARLRQLVRGRLSEEALKADLDADILALLVEEVTVEGAEDEVGAVLEQSLCRVQADKDAVPLEPLARVMTAHAREIIALVPDAGMRATYASTGLSSTSCRTLQQHITENARSIRRLLTEPGEGLDQFVNTIVPVCLLLDEMQPQQSISGSQLDLLRRWLAGAPVSTLLAESGGGATEVEDFGRFIDEAFGYRLPWGVAGYLRVAAKTLELSTEDLAWEARFLPSMIKYGLPDPASCWAMASGIPFRRIAMEVGATFVREVGGLDYRAFLEWLNELTSERLHNDFGLSSPVLEDVARAITVASLNSLLRDYEGLRALLPLTVQIRGVHYGERSLVAARLGAGHRLELLRDYDNIADRNAILVQVDGEVLGYVPRQEAQVLAPEMDTGAILAARVVDVSLQPQVQVMMELYSPE